MRKLRRLASFMLCIALALSMIPAKAIYAEDGDDYAYTAANDLANSWRYRNGEPFSTYTELTDEEEGFTPYTTWPEVEGAVAVGIDVSKHNGEIDWEKAKAAGVDYAIIRCGYGDDMESQDDIRWKENADACTKLDIPFGTYIYSYAMTVEQAESEAAHVLRLVKDYELDYPIYFDMEENKVATELTAEERAAIAQTFCDKIEAAGYEVGIYANKYWLETFLTDPAFEQWPVWCAQYNETCTYQGEYHMWQCSDSGQIDGINTKVDLNIDFGAGPYPEATYTPYRVIDSYVNYRTGPGTTYPLVGKLTQNRVVDVEDGYSANANGHTWYRFKLNGKEYYVAATYLKEASQAPVTMRFSDIPSNGWYYKYVKFVYENGYMNGMSDTVFSPDTKLTRTQFATILYRIAGSPVVKKTTRFVDVNVNDWYAEAVIWAAEAGIVKGYSDTVFGTNDSISREQMVTMMHRYAKYQNQDVTQMAELDSFKDASKISEYALEPMKWAVAAGLINGTGDGTVLDSSGNTTRAQAATVISRFVK